MNLIGCWDRIWFTAKIEFGRWPRLPIYCRNNHKHVFCKDVHKDQVDTRRKHSLQMQCSLCICFRGIRRKLLAARRLGTKQLVLPDANQKDVNGMFGRGALVTATIERLQVLPSEPENKNNKAQLDLARLS